MSSLCAGHGSRWDAELPSAATVVSPVNGVSRPARSASSMISSRRLRRIWRLDTFGKDLKNSDHVLTLALATSDRTQQKRRVYRAHDSRGEFAAISAAASSVSRSASGRSDQGTTSGSHSHPANFNTSNLALAAAAAREELLRRAGERLEVPVEQLVVDSGVIHVQANPSARADYGQLIGGKTFSLPLDNRAQRRHPSTWRVLGTPVPTFGDS